MMQWAMGDETPIEAEVQEADRVYDDPDKYGNIFDHFACVYQWQNGLEDIHFSRQQRKRDGL